MRKIIDHLLSLYIRQTPAMTKFYTEDTGSLHTPLDEPCTERQDYSEFSLERDNQKSTVAAVEVKN